MATPTTVTKDYSQYFKECWKSAELYLQSHSPETAFDLLHTHYHPMVADTIIKDIIHTVIASAPPTPIETQPVPQEITVPTIEQPDGDGEFSSPLAGALFAASRHIPQIPLLSRSKDAFIKGWQYLPTCDAGQIKKWAEEHPNCNFGSVAQHGGVMIFETDSAGPSRRFAGKFTSQFLVQSSTTERGHRYYKNNGMASIAQANSVHGDFSLRMNAAYCVSPGSIHVSGVQYKLVMHGELVEPTQDEVAFWNSERNAPPEKPRKSENNGDPGFQKLFDVVGWKPLIDRLSKHPDSRFHEPVLEPRKLMYCPMPGHYKPEDLSQKFDTTPFGVVEGSRLHCFACDYNGDMVDASNALDNNPINKGKLTASVGMFETARSICQENGLRFEDYFSGQEKPVAASNSKLQTRRGDQIRTKQITWLWNQRIPFRKLTVLAGNPDQGKSLVTMDISARLTSGNLLFGADPNDKLPPCDVLILAGEDEAADTIIPRLQGAGADLNRIHIVDSVITRNGMGETIVEREAQLDTDVQAIEDMLRENPEIKLVIIDPLSNYLGRANMNREQEVRQVLVPLKGLAERAGVSIVAVMHLNKNGDASAIHRVGGAVAFTGVARAAWLFTEDPEDKDKHLMLRIKGNIAKRVGGLVYKIITTPVMVEGGMTSQPLVEWVGQTESVASDVLMGGKPGRPDAKVKTAVEWLAGFLKDGSQLANDVYTFGYKAGHTKRTLTRAKDELKAESIRVNEGGRGKGSWEWWIPGTPRSGDNVVNLGDQSEESEESDVPSEEPAA